KSAFGSGAGHPVADTEACIRRIDLLDNSGGAISERCGTFQSVSNLFQRGMPAERSGRIEDFAYLIRPSACLLQQVHFGLLDFHFLRPNADHRVTGADEDTTGWRSGTRNLLHLHSAILILSDLFHALLIWQPSIALDALEANIGHHRRFSPA